ncbi:MAG: hypothetical protein ACYTGV_02835 [Planctomycetota bacterium]|jgi:hypothetical protein
MRRFLPLLLLAAACASTPSTPTEVPASEADVTASLYKQLELVLHRQAELEGASTEEAKEERAELLRLAAEIAVRIARMDPQADIPALIEQVESARKEAEAARSETGEA